MNNFVTCKTGSCVGHVYTSIYNKKYLFVEKYSLRLIIIIILLKNSTNTSECNQFYKIKLSLKLIF